ncbi:MAG: hypothetical protein HC859_13225 [Bacteroidia bacterium]|nr:hypothetical protein [Bacteroidia bacterium]
MIPGRLSGLLNLRCYGIDRNSAEQDGHLGGGICLRGHFCFRSQRPFSGQSAIFGSASNDVGEIAGIDISLEEYQNAIREREASYFLNFNREPGERERPFIEQQAWEMLVAKYAIQSQYAKVGVDVTTDEVLDMLLGKHIDENLKSTPLFLDETGQFDRNKVQNYLNSIKSEPATSEARIRWEMYQKDLAPARERIKYENLLIKTAYVTAAEAERNYHMQTTWPKYAICMSPTTTSKTPQ